MTNPIVNLIRRRPILAVFEVCLRCNSACGYCDLPLNVGRYELSRDEIRSIFTRLYADGLRLLFIQGGEPMLRQDLLAVLHDLEQIGFHLTLITNGTLFRADIVNKLAALNVSLSISLDTLNRARYAQIRGADQLRMVLRGLKLLEDYPHPRFLTCIVSEVNREDVCSVVSFANDIGFVPVVGAYHWDVERYGKVTPGLQYTSDQAITVFEELLSRKLVPAGYFRNYLRDNITWLLGRKLAACDAGRYSIAIDSSGNVAPCLALPHVGNLRHEDLATILERQDRAAIKRCSDASTCNLMCSRVLGSALRNPIATLRTARLYGARPAA